MENPLKLLRLEQGLNYREAAINFGINDATIEMAERGFYTDPPPVIFKILNIKEDEQQQITKAYHEYQIFTRKLNGPNQQSPQRDQQFQVELGDLSLSSPKLICNPTFRSDENPLYSWREQSGLPIYTLCTYYCLHMPTVSRFESKIWTFTEFPDAIYEPLRQAGYDKIEGLLEEFIDTFHLHKRWVSSHLMKVNNLTEKATNLEKEVEDDNREVVV